ncbi:hypothetical protein DID88_002284 [Monilinia fructigena]|uniref:RNase H type-1 domain-containing protein n=1 Tax=Monilinia fructigena TaxID=38457 RepID=A0A395ID14_9HELO|nr:hypothetical protein DID88_002284 [Monilinia fructigena]
MAPQTPHRPTIANADTHTRERTAVSPTPFQSIGVPYGTAPVPPVTNPTGSPALETVLDRLERMEREAALRRLVFGNFAATIEGFVRNSPEEHKVLAREILNGSNPENPTTPAASPTVAKNAPAGPLKEKTDLRIYARAEPGSLLVRDQPFLIREAIVKAVPQIVAKDIPRLWATPTGWAVKPSTKAVYDLILKESNAIAICRATLCTTLERVEKWSTYRLAHVPNVLTGLLDNQLVTADIVSKEAEIQTGSKPLCLDALDATAPFRQGINTMRRPQRRWMERTFKDGVQVVIPTPGVRVAEYEAANQQTRRVKRKTAFTESLNLAELSKRSIQTASEDEMSFIPDSRRRSEDCAIIQANGLKVAWANNRPMYGTNFIGDPEEPTHRAGHTINLTFLNILFAETKASKLMLTWATELQRIVWRDDLNDIARLLTILFQKRYQSGGEEKAQNAARSAPWWTPACAELHASYAKARQRSEPDQERKRRTMLSTIRNAKRDYWRRIIDNAAEDADLYKVVGWHKLSPSLKAPPLVVDGISIESTREKAEALLEKVLHRYNDSDDLDYDPLEAEVRRPTLPWTTAISLEETEKNVIGVSSTSPGAGCVIVRLLTACWQHIGEFIRDFFQRCFELIYFPSEWKFAEVVMLLKAGKRDKTLVRLWRPIALLLCIGKGLERLIARRIFWTAIHYRIISPQHGGALPKRSAVDLVASFVYNVESAFAQGKEVTLVILDVVKVRLEDMYIAELRMQCGTPQGSPLSPILYVLYLAELLNQDRALRFGYADDIAIYRASKWGAMNKVAFAPEKLEMIHLSRKRNASSPSVAVSPELIISPVTAVGEEQPALRWLGVWIDRKLSFKRHVSERASKALKVARHVKGLAGVKFSPPAASLRKAVITCVQSSLLYGSEIWYGGRLKSSAAAGYNRNQLVSTKLGPLIDKVNEIIVLAARGVLPAWRIAPIVSVLRDAGLPSGGTALEHAHALIPRAPRPILTQSHFLPGYRTDPTEGRTKEAAAEHFNAWWSQLGRDTITVFSDGTEQYKDGAKLVGYGYAVYRGQTLARTGSGAINSSISHVFDAEAIGALKGLQCALDILQPTDERIWMCIDSTSVIWCMRANASNTSQWAFLECHTLIDRYKVGIKWSPGHMGIEGNEAADELANTPARTRDGQTTIAQRSLRLVE